MLPSPLLFHFLVSLNFCYLAFILHLLILNPMLLVWPDFLM